MFLSFSLLGVVYVAVVVVSAATFLHCLKLDMVLLDFECFGGIFCLAFLISPALSVTLSSINVVKLLVMSFVMTMTTRTIAMMTMMQMKYLYTFPELLLSAKKVQDFA